MAAGGGGVVFCMSRPFAVTLALRAELTGGAASDRLSIEAGRGRGTTGPAGGALIVDGVDAMTAGRTEA
jgi:hypothetical protein